jgi:hypothetical protein
MSERKDADDHLALHAYHLYLENRSADRKPIITGPARIPLFIQKSGVIEPVLIDNDNQGRNRAVRTTHSASGFVVHQDGFILTNRTSPPLGRLPTSGGPTKILDRAGLLIDLDQQISTASGASIAPSAGFRHPPNEWSCTGSQPSRKPAPFRERER